MLCQQHHTMEECSRLCWKNWLGTTMSKSSGSLFYLRQIPITTNGWDESQWNQQKNRISWHPNSMAAGNSKWQVFSVWTNAYFTIYTGLQEHQQLCALMMQRTAMTGLLMMVALYLCQLGAPQLAVRNMTKTLTHLKHHVHTAFGDLDLPRTRKLGSTCSQYWTR